jgi:hypothetical protein
LCIQLQLPSSPAPLLSSHRQGIWIQRLQGQRLDPDPERITGEPVERGKKSKENSKEKKRFKKKKKRNSKAFRN